MTELEQYISSYFGIASGQDLQAIVALFKPEKIKKNTVILQTGAQCNKLSFVQSGLLRIFAQTQTKEVTQWISTKGHFVTDLSSFIFENQSRWTIQALSDTEIFTISKADYQKIGQLVPSWQTLEKLFLVRCFTTLEDRIFSQLSLTAEERYEQFFLQNKELFNQVPLQYIASLLGMTPETFSRIRKKQIG
jgi:CRP/FNR family transcriptional regulator, anaerobic regulatory protein